MPRACPNIDFKMCYFFWNSLNKKVIEIDVSETESAVNKHYIWWKIPSRIHNFATKR